MKTTKLWKSMRAGMLSGSGDIGPWPVNVWRTNPGTLVMCQSGFHASVRAIDAMRYVACEVMAEVEVRGKHLEQDDKQVWSEMRVVRAFRWTKKDSVAMAIYVAELVIGIYEKKNPDDKRPRQAIEAARAWLENPTEENRKAAYAAESAAYAAADAAAYAAYAAAESAAYAAASDAAAAAESAAYAAADAAAYAAAHAAYAADDKILDQVEAWIMERIKTLEEIR